ncbi:hypothetical protein AMQ28_04345 [Acinetobacter sp. TTH0-4]|uniref:hypothetical protein n=1 Tax=Acinetobacter sp. TTH0-4 TaxID=1646498 RepID=UPI0006AFCF67|nr:hypothetical protein [Acinetobacter sp. TTH0-4]ALD01656.1 hypothetical protein AMQ28_04345 [Acinetobacter sp. TTH0-4]
MKMHFTNVSLSSIRKANQNMIDGKKADTSSLPVSVQQDISKRRYSANEINCAYARAVSKG